MDCAAHTAPANQLGEKSRLLNFSSVRFWKLGILLRLCRNGCWKLTVANYTTLTDVLGNLRGEGRGCSCIYRRTLRLP